VDKNKSLYKLKGIPSILWLNLDSDTKRREYMETQFKYWEIENHTRISGYDGRIEDVALYLKGSYPENMIQNEVGCCLSHLKAIKHFYENTTEDYILIVEDDIVFDISC
jgi:GR25 family glycosyltransferase involved in LPS biosynthesis